VLRIEVREEGQSALPAVDIDDASFVIGSGPSARIRLPAAQVQPEHVRIDGTHWRTADGEGDIGDGITLELGSYRVRVAPAPTGTAPSPPQRTESLARELMRNLLGDGAAPTLEFVRGRGAPSTRALPPPESTLVIGRGDEANWIIVDQDLSRVHAEIRRGWDGTRIVDLGSKNGTQVDGTRITDAPLHDGATIELGKLMFRFHDPADRRLRPETPAAPPPPPRTSRAPFFAALAIGLLALAGLAWVLAA
jgi:pSer/pThr/pTyr-binding forkhead associated (FHA) protein